MMITSVIVFDYEYYYTRFLYKIKAFLNIYSTMSFFSFLLK